MSQSHAAGRSGLRVNFSRWRGQAQLGRKHE